MDMMGAAIATVISQEVSVILCIIYILIPEKKDFIVYKNLYKELLGRCFSMGFMSCIVSAGSVILQYGINGLGFLTIAGHTTASKLYIFFNMPFTAMALAISTFVSQNKGANQGKRVRDAIKVAYCYDAIVVIIVIVILLFFALALMKSISCSSESTVLNNGSLYLRIVGPFYAILDILMQTRLH